ncbi:unnamed protein product [Ceutorhynchus assimilis]|uniref:E3 ubiquitin-protein ligase n=1 Tax=Ceutorhynchus assimilis TaxID=467358 RepID=A0A9N9MGG1_9CUCU|nr:unnamed protein product [Ceutorhynchus assimilis]
MDKIKKQPIKDLSLLDQTKMLECSICLDVVVPPIVQCEVGHIMCKKCVESVHLKHCPICRQPITNRRHVAFEQLLESVRGKLETECRFSAKGCKYKVAVSDKDNHERDCRHRTFRCEGKIFADWTCDWTGEYSELENHFKTAHKSNATMQYTTKASIKVNFNHEYKDLQLISFFNGQAYFYYKHFVDKNNEKLYWTIQYVGLQSNAVHYFYEFEIANGPIRKIKVTEICYNDTKICKEIFEEEKCVVVPFKAAKSYLNENGELAFRFRITKIKH